MQDIAIYYSCTVSRSVKLADRLSQDLDIIFLFLITEPKTECKPKSDCKALLEQLISNLKVLASVET